MNAAHIHLLLNHIPVIGVPLVLLLLLYGILGRHEEVKKSAYAAFVIMAVVAIPTYWTGEPAENIIENLSGVSEFYFGKHEDAALWAMIGTETLGTLALAAHFAFRAPKIVTAWFLNLLLGMAVITSLLMAWTANLGGQIRHMELRSDTTLKTMPDETNTANEKDDD